MKKMIREYSLPGVAALLPMLFGAAVYARLPAALPTHWSFSGEADGFSAKAFVVFGLPLLMALGGLIVRFFLDHDPRRADMYPLMRTLSVWLCPVFSLVLVPSTILIGLGCSISMTAVVFLILGVMFLILGNYLPKCRRTYTMGIRLPWTLASEENWRRTHRFAGKLWVLGGLLLLTAAGLKALSPAGMSGSVLAAAAILLALLPPAVYSFLLFKKGI